MGAEAGKQDHDLAFARWRNFERRLADAAQGFGQLAQFGDQPAQGRGSRPGRARRAD
jgi:hypothetical protein